MKLCERVARAVRKKQNKNGRNSFDVDDRAPANILYKGNVGDAFQEEPAQLKPRKKKKKKS